MLDKKLDEQTAELIVMISKALLGAKAMPAGSKLSDADEIFEEASARLDWVEVKYQNTSGGVVLATVSVDGFEPFFFRGPYKAVRIDVLKSLLSYVRRATKAYEDDVTALIGDYVSRLIEITFAAELDPSAMTARNLHEVVKCFYPHELKDKVGELVNRVVELVNVNKALKLAAFALGAKTLSHNDAFYHSMSGVNGSMWLRLSVSGVKGGVTVALNTKARMVPVVHFGTDGEVSFIGEIDHEVLNVAIAFI